MFFAPYLFISIEIWLLVLDIWQQFSNKTQSLDDDSVHHEKCKVEYKQLKDEFDKFKIKSNQLIKSKQHKVKIL